jgi:hypothetical protein
MDQNQEIISELKSINKKLEKLTKNSKFALRNFVGGTFNALGAVFGTLIVASALIYIFSRFNFTTSISKWIENTMSQINWTKIVSPQTQIIQQQNIKSN